MDSFKKKYSLEKRIEESTRILNKYPDRIPVIVERSDNCKSGIPSMDKKKFLVPCDLTAGQFMYVIRKRIKIDSEQAIFLFINGKLPPSNVLLSQIYNDEHEEDKFLYIQYSGENVFG